MKCLDLVGIRSIICYGLEEDVEGPEKSVHLEGESNGVAGPVDVDAFDKVDYTNVKHIKNGDGSLLGLALLKCQYV